MELTDEPFRGPYITHPLPVCCYQVSYDPIPVEASRIGTVLRVNAAFLCWSQRGDKQNSNAHPLRCLDLENRHDQNQEEMWHRVLSLGWSSSWSVPEWQLTVGMNSPRKLFNA